MKLFAKRWIIVTLMLLLISTQAYAASRVISQVEVVTDKSAEIALKWSDNNAVSGIMITSWRFTDAETLVVSYRTGADVPGGFSSRVISHDTYSFPLKVHLEASTDHVPEFTDINTSDPGRNAVLNLYYRGIIGGYPDGSFKPDNHVTRAEFSKMLLLTADYEVQDALMTSFSDVSQEFWGRKFIMTLASKDILKGKGDGKFDPNGQIKMGEVLAVLTRTFELYEGDGKYLYTLGNHWSNAYFLKAVEDGIVLPIDSYYRDYDAEMPATREQCAVLLSRVLENLHDVAE